jgi:hypothetical protein
MDRPADRRTAHPSAPAIDIRGDDLVVDIFVRACWARLRESAVLINVIGLAGLFAWMSASIFAAPSPAAVGPPSRIERGTFLMLIKGDTVLSDRFSRTPRSVEGTMTVAGSPWQSYSMVLGSDASVMSTRVGMYPPHASAKDTITMHVTADLRGDSIRVGHRNREGLDERMFPASRNTLIGVNASVAFLEQVVRRAHSMGDHGGSEISIFLPEHGQVWQSTVTQLGSDSTRLVMAGDEWHLATDRDGRILGGWGAGNLQIRRVSQFRGR